MIYPSWLGRLSYFYTFWGITMAFWLELVALWLILCNVHTNVGCTEKKKGQQGREETWKAVGSLGGRQYLKLGFAFPSVVDPVFTLITEYLPYHLASCRITPESLTLYPNSHLSHLVP